MGGERTVTTPSAATARQTERHEVAHASSDALLFSKIVTCRYCRCCCFQQIRLLRFRALTHIVLVCAVLTFETLERRPRESSNASVYHSPCHATTTPRRHPPRRRWRAEATQSTAGEPRSRGSTHQTRRACARRTASFYPRQEARRPRAASTAEFHHPPSSCQLLFFG